MKVRSFLVAASAAFALTACDSATAPSNGMDAADVNQLASDVDALTQTTLGGVGVSALGLSYSISPSGAAPLATVSTISRTFSATHACPAGGTVSIAGSVTGTSDPVAQNLSITHTAVKTDTNCAFNTKNGVVTINGNPNVTITGTVNVVAGKPSGPQTLSHKGSYTWTRGTASGTCNIDVTSVFDPTAGTFTVTGMMCGRTVNISRTAPKFP